MAPDNLIRINRVQKRAQEKARKQLEANAQRAEKQIAKAVPTRDYDELSPAAQALAQGFLAASTAFTMFSRGTYPAPLFEPVAGSLKWLRSLAEDINENLQAQIVTDEAPEGETAEQMDARVLELGCDIRVNMDGAIKAAREDLACQARAQYEAEIAKEAQAAVAVPPAPPGTVVAPPAPGTVAAAVAQEDV